MNSINTYFFNGRLALISEPKDQSIDITGYTSLETPHTMSMSIHAIDALRRTKKLIELKPTDEMNKLEYYKQFYPDAVEYQDKNQSYIREDQASFIAYGKEVNAKCLFYRDIPGSTGVLQQFIFSEKAFLDDEKLRVHQQQLMEPYH